MSTSGVFREVLPRQCGEPPSVAQGHAHAIAWSCEGKLATGTSLGWVVLHDLDAAGNARVKSSFPAAAKDGVELNWHPFDKNELVTCANDKTMKVWDVRSPKDPVQVHTSDGENFCATYSPDGRYVAMGSIRKDRGAETDLLAIYDLRMKKRLKSVKIASVMVHDYRWSPNGEYIILSTDKGQIEILAFGTTRPLSKVKSMRTAHTSNCQEMDIDPLHRYLACGGSDGLVSLWELEDFVCVRTIERCEVGVKSVSFSADGRFLAIGMSDRPTEIAEVETGALAHTIESSGCSAVRFHPRRPVLAGIASRPGRGEFGLRMWSFLY